MSQIYLYLEIFSQFTKEHGARSISWVPRKLAPQVRLVIAMVTDSEVHKALQERETKPIEVFVDSLDCHSKKVMFKNE